MLNIGKNFKVYQTRAKRVNSPWRECTLEEYQTRKADGWPVRVLGVIPTYAIRARRWFDGRRGWSLHTVELYEIETGNRVMACNGQGGGSGWSQTICDMMQTCPDLFPPIPTYPYGLRMMSNTEYFREVCNIPYDVMDVEKKSQLAF